MKLYTYSSALLSLIFYVTNVYVVTAQTPFKVLAVRGSVKIETRQAAIGQQVKSNDKISITGSGYLSMAHVNGRTVELRKAGTYRVSDLDKAARKKSGSSTSKFAAYVLNELTEVKEPISFTSAKRSHMNTTGSVDRIEGEDVDVADTVLAMVGGAGELQALAAIQSTAFEKGTVPTVVMPRHTRLFGDSIEFTWHGMSSGNTYRLVVVDADNKIIHEQTTSDTNIASQTASLGMQKGVVYYWHVEQANDASARTDEYALLIVDGNERNRVTEVIGEIGEDTESDTTAIGQLILATAFEDLGLNYDAYRAYSRAITMAPDVQNYKRMYAEFLTRQGLNLEAFIAYR